MQIIKPRWYQENLIAGTYDSWRASSQNVCVVAPTGSGKTYIKGFIAKEFALRKKYVVILAHRDVLISQISLSLATLGVRHTFLCNKKTENFTRDLHVAKLGHCFYDGNASVCVASVGTINRRNTTSWESSVGLWLMDETHHLLRENQWGRAVSKFENAHGLGVTATPIRIDKKGLGRHADGVFDDLIKGPTLGDLIESGDLCKYRIVSTPLSKMVRKQSQSIKLRMGDYDPKESKALTSTREIYGDIVSTYKKFAMGQRGITFGVDIEHCEKLAQCYRDGGVPAIALSSKTPEKERWQYLEKFTNGEILQLVNCDLFGEGFDVPACNAVTFARMTKSYGLYTQQFGRGLRNSPGKEYAWIFDHVGNIEEHRLPDNGLDWALDRQEKRKKSNNSEKTISLTTCTNPDCLSDYELPASQCPWCGTPYAVNSRKPLKNVDGELVELTEEELNVLRGEKKRIDLPVEKLMQGLQKGYAKPYVREAIASSHLERQRAQAVLRERMKEWSLKQRENGLSPEQAQAQFALLHGIDIHTAQTISKKDAENLLNKIEI